MQSSAAQQFNYASLTPDHKGVVDTLIDGYLTSDAGLPLVAEVGWTLARQTIVELMEMGLVQFTLLPAKTVSDMRFGLEVTAVGTMALKGALAARGETSATGG